MMERRLLRYLWLDEMEDPVSDRWRALVNFTSGCLRCDREHAGHRVSVRHIPEQLRIVWDGLPGHGSRMI
jgi:hypothetical protein